jgi:hypothetical protein
VQFSAATYTANESDNFTQVTITRTGDTSTAATVDYQATSGTASDQRNYITAIGTLSFAAGDTSKTFTVLLTNNQYVEGPVTLNLMLSNPTGNASLGTPSTAQLTINDNSTSQPSTNRIDEAQYFVREQYHDFLNREPDAGGFDYWTTQITNCGTDQSCINRKRIDVSAAFFISEEFQQTGYYVYRVFKASFGRQPTYLEYINGLSQVWAGTDMAARQSQYAAASVNPAYASLSNADYVDQLYRNAGVVPDAAERNALVNGLNAQPATETRGSVLQKIANNQTFQTKEYNAAFVLAEYFGYLRRDPDAGSYQFWLDVINNRVPNNYRSMVCAFITSKEYQDRFSPVTTRTDKVCGAP